MSGTDYTQTPYYGLYKPTVDADSDQWGGHWNTNADTLDNALHTLAAGGGGTPSSTTPSMDGVGAAGIATTYARGDHVHPTDTSRYAATNPSGYQTATQVATALAPYAPLASPVFTGTPSLPTGTTGITQTAGTSNTTIATTAFVAAAAAGAYVLPTASTTVLGGVKVDGTTVTIASGVISASGSGYTLPTASTTVLGGVKVDGTTVTIAAGVISAAAANFASPPAIGSTTPSTGKFTTIQSTIATGTAPLTVASTTNVANLNASSLNGATFAAPGAIGGTTAAAGAFTTLSATSTTTLAALTSTGITASPISGSTGSFTTLAASSTVSGTGFTTYLASPPAIGGTAAAAGAFTTLSATSTVSGAGFTTLLAPYQTSANVISAIAGGNPGAFSTLSASSTVSGVGFSTYLASPPAIGGTTPSTGKFTTVQSTIATGTAPFTVASTTNVANLNASSLSGATFAAPGAIGGTTAAAGAFTTLSAASTVSGSGFSTYLASPPAIGGTAAAAGSFTTLNATGATLTGALNINTGGGATSVTASGAHLQLTAASGGLVLLGSNTMATAGFALGNGSGTQSLAINGAAGGASGVLFQAAGNTRWGLLGDASDNLTLNAYSAVGAYLGNILAFSQGPLLTTFNQPVTVNGVLTTTGLTSTGAQSLPLPSAAKTGTAYTLAATDCSLLLAPTGTFTLTLPAASASTGRIVRLKLTAAFAVNSASSNIVQLVGGAATAAIMPATAGKFALLQSDGTSWQLMQAN